MSALRLFRPRSRCERKGHDFMFGGSREFIPTTAICLRCGARRTDLPWGTCLSGHPIAEHYGPDGSCHIVADCAGPS